MFRSMANFIKCLRFLTFYNTVMQKQVDVTL